MSRRFCLAVIFAFVALMARAETMLQYFNTSWAEITRKMPELAEAGYTSLWLPPPTKGSGGLSVGYDMWDPFDLGSKNQRGSVKTRYGTEAELLTLVETAHRFGIRIYFDNIMNHRAFDVPGYNENTPVDTYPGLVPEDFHLRLTQDGFYRKWDNTRSWNDSWQVQNLGLADLIDIAQEPGTTNINFGTSEGGQAPKIKFLRDATRPDQYCYLPDGTYVGFGPGNGITTALVNANPNFYSEYVQDYLNRAARWLMDRTKADGLRLDAVKHVRADFFGATYGVDKDSSDYGYTGQVQRQFNISRGFSDTNHRDTLFDTEKGRDDAMMFGEHLGEPPAYGPFIDAGMRLVDNPLRQQLNDKLGNPSNGLNGYDNSGAGGFSADQGVMHAQSHDNDYAARRELQHAFYYLRAGLGLLYTDGNYQAETLGESGGAFPRHANTAFLGQWGDGRVPNLLYTHDQFARGSQRGVWSDEDLVAWIRTDYREGGMSEANATTLFVLLCDNFANGRKINDKPGADGANVGFSSDAYLYNYSTYGGGFYKYGGELKETLAPAGGYFAFSWKNPDPSVLWSGFGGKTITITQGGTEVGTVAITRKDGPNGDAAFNGGTLPAESRPTLVTDAVTTDYKYTALVPRVTNGSAVKFIARTDGSAENILLKLDSGINLNATNHAGGDSRDHPPGLSTDVFHGYEQPNFVGRIHPELFAAMNTGLHNVTGSTGAETYRTAGVSASGYENGKYLDGDTASFLYHDPAAPVGNITPSRNQYDAGAGELWAKTNSVGGGYRMFLYYTDGSANPEGAAGQPHGATKVVEMLFDHNDDSGASDWWKTGTLPGDFTSASKYKIGIHKHTAASWQPLSLAAVTRKVKMMTTFETSARDLTTTQFRPHADYGATQTGLSEGFHVIRARAFLDRLGKASIYNTFTQTFYYDTQTPTGEVRFPATNGDTVGGSEYGAVIRTDPSVTEVWFNIADGDADNDDAATRTTNGNGAGFEPFTDSNANGTRDTGEAFEDLNENTVWDAALTTSWVRATEVTPSLNFQPTNAAFSKEWRFNYTNIPATGTATINVRLRELSSAAYKDFALSDAAGHYTTLTRSVNTAGPDIRMFIAYPQNNGDTIGDGYVMKCYFTKALADGLTAQQLIDRFTIRLGGNDDAATLTAYARDTYSIAYNETVQYHALAFTLPNLYNDQPDYLHKIEVTHDRPTPSPDLTATRLIKFTPSQIPRISIVTPPELDSDGKPFEIVLPDKASPTAEDRQYLVRVSTGLDATSVVMTVNSGPVTFTGPVTSTEGSTKYWDFTWTNMQQGEFRFTATVNPGGNENHDTRSARVFFRQVVPVSSSDPDDDDDGLLDGDEATATPLPNGFPTDDARYKPNTEQWTNGDIHIHKAYGSSNPASPDSDGDLLPDGLEVGWRNATIIGESFSDVGYGTSPVIGAGNGVFDWNDANGNFAHDVGEASEPFTDTDADTKFDFGTIIGRDTNGDGILNFIGDLDPPFYNTLDNLGSVPGVNSASEGGDRAKQMRGSVTNPNDADSDDDGIKDGVEDANRNGWLDGDGASIPVNFNPWLARNWPDAIRNPGETWTETSPNDADTDDDGASDGFGEDKNFDGLIAGDTNHDRIWQSGEVWTETDPLNADTDGDGLPDGWEKRYNLDPLDNGTATFTGLAANAVNGASGNADGDTFTNAQELASGTSPREDDTVPPPPPGSIIIGPQAPIVAGNISQTREFTDWAIGDLIVLDQYDGDGPNNQGGDVYHGYDGFDSSRDLVAFYAHDGGSDGLFHFRVDMQDLKAYAEEGNLDIYVVIDFNSPATGESALPDDIDTRTNMKWEVCVACYSTDNGAVWVDTPASANTTSINQTLADFGVQRRSQSDANGFKKSYFSSVLDAVEFSISRQALLDAGWNGDSTKLNYQVFTTKDGTQNSPTVGAGNIGGRSDIRDAIYDDYIASDYWRDQSSISGQGSVLYSWFGVNTGAGNDRFKRAKVVSLIHEARPIIPGSETQALINTGASAGFYRPLDVHEAFSVPFALHIPPTLASAFQWAKVDPAANKPWRDGPAFNARLSLLATGGIVQFLGTTFADHPLPYFPQAYTNDNIALANEWMTGFYTSAPSASVLYPAERVLSTDALSRVQGAGFGFTIADQMRHYLKWFGRTSALGNDGYRINRVNGVKLCAVSDQASSFRFLNTDGGLGTSLRELLNRKARSGQQDQVVVLGSDWSDFLSKTNADAYDTNVKWMASRPWIALTTPQEIAAGSVDSNADGSGDTWSVVERGTMTLAPVAKDYIDHATQENYDHWFFGQSGREEGLSAKVFNIRPGAPLPLAWGQVGVSGVADTSWTNANGISTAHTGLRGLGRGTFHAATYLSAFHDQSNGDLSKFSTGDYINPDTTLQNLAGFSKAAQAQARHASVLARVAQWATDANSGLATLSATQEDVDLDGENECLLLNARIFAVFERIGGRLTAAWVRDITNGKVFQCVGNPIAYSGFETEQEGAANVIGGLVGSYRTSGLKDWFAAGPNSIAYNNDLYAVASAPTGTGWKFTSSDGKLAKTVTLAALGNSLQVSYTLDASITTLYVRHGLSPHLLDLLKRGQTGLVSSGAVDGTVNVSTQGTDGTVRDYVRVGGTGFTGATWNNAAVDDDAGQSVLFDTLNMRNQAQTEQVELAVTNGATFAMGFETGPTLSLDSDEDGLPDSWEQAHSFNGNDPNGSNGSNGNPDGDSLTNEQEFIVGRNPHGRDDYHADAAKVAQGFQVSFDTIADRYYNVSFSDDLVTWTTFAADVLGDGTTKTVTDDGNATTPHPNTRPRRFYKVAVRLVNP